MADISTLLSAYLDNELTEAERIDVEAALSLDPALRAELDELATTRSFLRSLPQLTMPDGLLDAAPSEPATANITTSDRVVSIDPNRQGRTKRFAIAVTSVAALWLVVLSAGVSVGRLPVVPDIDQLSDQHAAADPLAGFQLMTADEMHGDPAVLTDLGDGMTPEGMFERDGLVHVRYSDGIHDVSVFHQQGTVDWDAMPASGNVEMMDDGPVWRAEMNGNDVVVTERGDLVVVIVADGDMDDMAMKATEMVPAVDIDESIWSKLTAAPGNLWGRVS